jgi:hypothetical protein
MSNSNPLHRLLGQLHALSEVNETLTVRLLDLEERMQQMDAQLSAQQAVLAEGDKLLLAAADARIGRLQNLLEPKSGAAPAPCFSPRPQPQPQLVQKEIEPASLFADEPEQLFMDDQLGEPQEEPQDEILAEDDELLAA